MKKQNVEIKGMTCTACAASIERNLSKAEGIDHVSVNFATEKMTVEYNESMTNLDSITRLVSDVGYEAVLPEAQTMRSKNSINEHQDTMYHRLVYSILFTLPVFYLAMGQW